MGHVTQLKHTSQINDSNVESRIGRNITPQPNGCWLYGTDPDKYGLDRVAVGTVHRFVYETLVGAIPDGHHLHHKCKTKACCNPAHLEPLTPAEHAAAHAES